MIKPTVGRKVWFCPSEQTIADHDLVTLPNPEDQSKLQPLDATVIGVHSDTSVNLFVIDSDGSTICFQEVELLQDDMSPNDEDYAMWMPYQVAQAAKVADGVVQPVTGTVV